ncbi:peptidase S28, partial [Kipferlia bialata]|eukprot:g12498.t1
MRCSSLVLLVALAAVALCDPIGQQYLQAQRHIDSSRFPAQYVLQRLDHFNLADARTFAQRYYVNDDYWTGDMEAPIFLEIGCEGQLSGPGADGDEISMMAEAHGGKVLGLEH